MLWEQLKYDTATFWFLCFIFTTNFNIEKYLGVASFKSREARDGFFGFGRCSLFSIETLP